MPQDDEVDEFSPDDEGALTPDDLDITDDERVAEIEEGRYVISSSGERPQVPDEGEDEGDTSDESGFVTVTDEAIYEWLRNNVESAEARYGFDVTAKFGDSVRRQELFSNDVVTTFENLLVWYSQHVGKDTPVEEALGILLMESTVPVRYPASTIQDLVSSHGLEPDDSIQELLDAVAQSGVRFPPDDQSE